MSSNRNNQVKKNEEKNFFDKIEDTLNDIVEPFAKTTTTTTCKCIVSRIFVVLFFVSTLIFVVLYFLNTRKLNELTAAAAAKTAAAPAALQGGRYSLNDISITSP